MPTNMGPFRKKRVEFSGRHTEVTAEEPKETNDNVNKKYSSSYMLTRRPNSGFSRDKPTDVNLDLNFGQFYSSSFDGFNLWGGVEVVFLAHYF
jgi:hypothetical protein